MSPSHQKSKCQTPNVRGRLRDSRHSVGNSIYNKSKHLSGVPHLRLPRREQQSSSDQPKKIPGIRLALSKISRIPRGLQSNDLRMAKSKEKGISGHAGHALAEHKPSEAKTHPKHFEQTTGSHSARGNSVDSRSVPLPPTSTSTK